LTSVQQTLGSYGVCRAKYRMRPSGTFPRDHWWLRPEPPWESWRPWPRPEPRRSAPGGVGRPSGPRRRSRGRSGPGVRGASAPRSRLAVRRATPDSPSTASRPSDPGREPGVLSRAVALVAMRLLIAARGPTVALTGERGRILDPVGSGFLAKLGRVHTSARRGQGASASPHGLLHPGPRMHPSSSCTTGRAQRCCGCRTEHRQRRAARRDRRSGRSQGAQHAGNPGASSRAGHAIRRAPGR
jgi:hypothetical protein